MKNYIGKLTLSLTGIRSSNRFPVVNGFTTIIINDVVISIVKINKSQVRIQLVIDIPSLNFEVKTYIAVGNFISKNKIQLSMYLKTDSGDNILLTDGIISFSDKKNFKFEFVCLTALGSQGAGNGSFKLACEESLSIDNFA